MAELLEEIHPGEILREEFMKPMGITARQLAADIDMCRKPPGTIEREVIRGQITPRRESSAPLSG
ncbi:MAG: hypothetical protein IT509_13305 [Rhodocyclaceae bacterium]|nr:hypothetical protein [Rhodocyclaceae bacterium]